MKRNGSGAVSHNLFNSNPSFHRPRSSPQKINSEAFNVEGSATGFAPRRVRDWDKGQSSRDDKEKQKAHLSRRLVLGGNQSRFPDEERSLVQDEVSESVQKPGLHAESQSKEA
ncbi:hypothetical protein MMC14_004931 [Varicellaria rhodocarpa]|nr:hypothetical protein [Varicellaria rhodocarpa]